MKSRIVGYSYSDKYDSDFNSDTDDSSSEGDEEITGNDADKEHSFDDDDDDDLFDNLVNISASTFHGMRVFDSVNNSILANEERSPSDQPIFAPYFDPK